jgi:periplasmic protein TonB
MSKASQNYQDILFTDLMLWAGAFATVIVAYGSITAWTMQETPTLPADAPPPVIMIELSPQPEATNTEETEVSVDQQDTQASTPAQEVKAPAPEPPEEEVPDTPTPEVTKPSQTTKDLNTEEVIPNPEVTLITSSVRPKMRSKSVKDVVPPRSARPKPAPQPSPQKKSAASQSMVKAQNQQAQKSARNAALQSARGSGRTISPAKWQSRLLAHLERRKPRSKGERGVAYVTFRLDAAGTVLSVRLARSSGNPAIDQAAVSLVRRASPVPPPPPDASLTITVPVKFNRR